MAKDGANVQVKVAAATLSDQLQRVTDASTAGELQLPCPEDAVLAAIAYADLFDYPLTAEQVFRYQVGTSCTHAEVENSLDALTAGAARLARTGDFYSLPGRESLVQIRRDREELSAKLWKRARSRANWVAHTPFVRMVAVTGALSMNNISGKPDIDLLVVTRPGRVWICRRLLILQVRIARLLGDDLCPNYILSSSKLELDQRDFFTAHELAQMVPMHGLAIHGTMLKRNPWAYRFLPAAFHDLVNTSSEIRRPSSPLIIEKILGAKALDSWEAWELRRLRRKLAPLIGNAAEVVCAPDQCKGHTGLHRSNVMARFAERLRALGIYEGFAHIFDADNNSKIETA